MALKYLHFARDHYYPNVPVKEAVTWLNRELGLNPDNKTCYQLLMDLRAFDESGGLAPEKPDPFEKSKPLTA